ncbi:hypothetical protein HZQ13_05760 [Elizabethkingia anophelis]|nr:hypothetical protein [Elizabethkingia anophelis]
MVNKIKDYRDNNQQLSSPKVDWEEFGKDYDSRSFLQSVANRLTELSKALEIPQSCMIEITIRFQYQNRGG